MTTATTHRDLLAIAGQRLLEYNASTEEIVETLRTTASSLSNDEFNAAVSFNGIVVSLGDAGPIVRRVKELRYNQALQEALNSILQGVRSGEVTVDFGLSQLNRLEADTPSHARWVVAILLGIAAASLARILGADFNAMVISGVSSALGLLARKELGRRHFTLLMLPLTAAFIGAALAGIVTRFGWTHTPGLAVIVPSLMLVPGPHLLNGLFDLVDGYIPMALARLALSTGILFASAVGIVLGIELTLSEIPSAGQLALAGQLNLLQDMLLAGLVALGFALFYNATWHQALLSSIGGMAGHGTRFWAVESDIRLESATLFGGLVVGAIAALIARRGKMPVAVIAFAGAVTMMPGVQMYRTFGGALQMARLKGEIDPTRMSATLGDALQSTFVIAALALGLIVATRTVPALLRLQKVRD